MYRMSIIVAVICICAADYTVGLVAYDCRGVSINKTTISLVETPTCMEKIANLTSRTVSLAITQTTTVSEIEFSRCSIEAFHMVQRCGSMIDTWHKDGHYSEVYHVTREECNEMIKSKVLNLRWGKSIRLTLPKSGTKSFSYISFGEINGGKCSSGGTLVSPAGLNWDSAIRSTRLDITYTTGTARLFHDEGVIKFPNGISCKIEDEKCDHSGYGQVFWSNPSPNCDSLNPKNSLVFKGNGILITDNDVPSGTPPNVFIHVVQGHFDFQIQTCQVWSICLRILLLCDRASKTLCDYYPSIISCISAHERSRSGRHKLAQLHKL